MSFKEMIDDITIDCTQVGPNGGYHIKKAPEYLDAESKKVTDLIYERDRPLQRPESEK